MRNSLVLVHIEYSVGYNIIPYTGKNAIFYNDEYGDVFIGIYTASIHKDVLNNRL